jgi:hypothetical protein
MFRCGVEVASCSPGRGCVARGAARVGGRGVSSTSCKPVTYQRQLRRHAQSAAPAARAQPTAHARVWPFDTQQESLPGAGNGALLCCAAAAERKKERSTPVSRRALRGHSVNWNLELGITGHAGPHTEPCASPTVRSRGAHTRRCRTHDRFPIAGFLSLSRKHKTLQSQASARPSKVAP